MVREFGLLNAAEIYLLRVQGKTIGAQINVLLGDTSFLLKTAYDETLTGLSPGHLLIDFAYQCYAEEGQIKTLNLISDYEWFRHWNPRYLNYVTLRAYSRTPLGFIGAARHLFSSLRAGGGV